ncbi:MAG: AAA family ATPase [Candidatus Binatia bacterium]
MKFSEVVAQTLALLQRERRITYRALKREFSLEDDALEDLKAELIEAKRVASDEGGTVLVWVGRGKVASGQRTIEETEPKEEIPSLLTSNSGLQTASPSELPLYPTTAISASLFTEQQQKPLSTPAAESKPLPSLLGREREMQVLYQRWQEVKARRGQGVLITGEPGIGKSRVVRTFTVYALRDGATHLDFRCSPYHQHTPLYPVIEYFRRMLRFAPTDPPQKKLEKLSQWLSTSGFPEGETLPLLAVFLSLPHPTNVPPFSLTAQKQRDQICEILIAWLSHEAEQSPLCCTWTDLHWADPSTVDLLTFFIPQIATTRVLLLLEFRSGFTPPWGPRAYLNQLTIHPLDQVPLQQFVKNLSGSTNLPPETIQQIETTTKGVPLFVKELTKDVVESIAAGCNVPLLLAIPTTLSDCIMARLDRRQAATAVAQIAATIGQEFSLGLLQALHGSTESTVQLGLSELLEADLISQRGIPPHVTYGFKHTLVQDAAYQSLSLDKRQQYHQQLAEMLPGRRPETEESLPEILAHHYTAAGQILQALPYWQQVGEKAVARAAYSEATQVFKQGIALLQHLPATTERTQQEMLFQAMLGNILVVTRGISAPEVGETFSRVYTLCTQCADTDQLFSVLMSLRAHHSARGNAREALTYAEQLMQIAQQEQDPGLLLQAHVTLGMTHYMHGAPTLAHEHCQQALCLYDPTQHLAHALLYGYDPKVLALEFSGLAHWFLGYPDQALQKCQEALAYAREIGHPYTVIAALTFTSWLDILRREEERATDNLAESVGLCTELGVPVFLALGTVLQGRVLAHHENEEEEGLGKIQEALAVAEAIEAHGFRSEILACQAAVYLALDQSEDGMFLVDEAVDFIQQTGEQYYEAELDRLRGELLLAQEGSGLQAEGVRDKTEEAGKCFLRAIEIAQRQEAKSLELRAAVSLARLWQQQGKPQEALQVLSEVYNWFTEGFETKDLQEAKTLLAALS